MERLTSYKSVCKREMICRHEDCDTCKEYCPYMNEDNCPCLQEVLEKLAAYEDIGLKPEQIREIDKLYAEKCKELAELEKKSFSGIEMVKIWANLQKLKEYKELEDKGKLLKLPYAVGDTVYRVHKGTKLSPDRVYECKVVGVKQEYNTFSVKLHANINEETYSIWVDNWFDKCQIGHEFFLTEEEAEAALKEL